MSDYQDMLLAHGHPEYEESFTGDVRIWVTKVGGGTIGRRYEGAWWYAWFQGERLIHQGSDLWTGTPKTHEEAVRVLFDFIAQSSEDGESYPAPLSEPVLTPPMSQINSKWVQ